MVAILAPLLPFPGVISLGGVALTTAAGGLTFAGSLLNLGFGLALNAALAPDVPTLGPQNIKLNGAEDTAARLRSYGQRRLGYARVLFDVKDGVFVRVIVHGHGQWKAIDAYYIDRRLVSLDGSGFVTDDKFEHNNTKLIQVVSRLGETPSQHISQIEDLFSYWDNTHRLDGLAVSMLKVQAPPIAKVNEIFPNREPNLEVVGRSSLVYDPRNGQTDYSANAALVIRDFITHPDGFDRPDSVDDDYFKAAADICDDQIALKEGGTAARYEYHGSYGLTETRLDVLKRLQGSCAADVFFLPNGKIGIEVGAWYEPDFTLTEDMVINHNYSTGTDPINGFNQLSVKYEDPDQNFAVVDAELWEDESRIESEGPSQSEHVCGGHTHMQARSIAKILMDRQNPKSRLTVSCKPAALEGFFETRIRVYMPTYGISGVYRVTNKNADMKTLGVTFELSEIRQTAYSLTLAEQGDKPVLPTTEEEGSIPTVSGFAAGPQGVQTAQNSFSAGIGAAWAASSNPSLTPIIEYSVADAENWQAQTLSEDTTAAVFSGLSDGGLYDIRVAYITSGGTVGDYVYARDVVASADTTAPASPTVLVAVDGGSGTADISLTTSASAGLWKTEIRRDGTLIATLYDAPETAVSLTDTPGVGTFNYTARSVNVSGVQNASDAGPVAVTTT